MRWYSTDDFVKIMNERWGGVAIELADVQVQGEVAPEQIVRAIDYFNAHAQPPEVLIVTRGGGSAEDLAAFNTEQVTRAVAASRIVQPGPRQITAQNPDGGSSNAVILTVTAPPAVLTSLSPSRVQVNGPEFTLTVTGTGLVAGATVVLGDTPLATTFISATQLSAVVPASLTQKTGPFAVTASNPGGGISNSLTLTVIPPTPTVSGISPTSVTFGGPEFILTIMGDGFLPGAIWLGSFTNHRLEGNLDPHRGPLVPARRHDHMPAESLRTLRKGARHERSSALERGAVIQDRQQETAVPQLHAQPGPRR